MRNCGQFLCCAGARLANHTSAMRSNFGAIWVALRCNKARQFGQAACEFFVHGNSYAHGPPVSAFRRPSAASYMYAWLAAGATQPPSSRRMATYLTRAALPIL